MRPRSPGRSVTTRPGGGREYRGLAGAVGAITGADTRTEAVLTPTIGR
jgi:hypothetical protein